MTHETNEERLKMIKVDWAEKQKTYQFRPLTLEVNDVDWLICHAEQRLGCEDAFDKLLKETAKVDGQYAALHREWREQAKEVESLKKALEFYANKDNYSIWTDSSNNCPTNNITLDDGYRARQAIKKEEAEYKIGDWVLWDTDCETLILQIDSISSLNEEKFFEDSDLSFEFKHIKRFATSEEIVCEQKSRMGAKDYLVAIEISVFSLNPEEALEDAVEHIKELQKKGLLKADINLIL